MQLKTVCAICLSIQTALCNANLALQKKDQPVIRQIVTGGWVVGKKNETAVDCQYSTKNDQQLNKRLELTRWWQSQVTLVELVCLKKKIK